MKLIDLLTELDPSIRTLRDSPAYGKSKELVHLRVQAGLNQSEAAMLMGIPFDLIVSMECPPNDIPLEGYDEVISRFRSLLEQVDDDEPPADPEGIQTSFKKSSSKEGFDEI